jgi:hypothetical protein
MERAIFPGQLACRILREFPAALVKILTFLYQLLAGSNQIIRDFLAFAY